MIKNKFYFPALDGFRFIAFLMVFIDHSIPPITIAGNSILYKFHHSGFLNFGVDLFFVLSAFLITKLLMIEHSIFGNFSIKDFLIRRALRIYPLYFFTLFICIIVLPIFLNHSSVVKFGTDLYFNDIINKNLIPHLFFFANNTLRYSGGINPYFVHL